MIGCVPPILLRNARAAVNLWSAHVVFLQAIVRSLTKWRCERQYPHDLWLETERLSCLSLAPKTMHSPGRLAAQLLEQRRDPQLDEASKSSLKIRKEYCLFHA